jgi:hypothetical protein
VRTARSRSRERRSPRARARAGRLSARRLLASAARAARGGPRGAA